MMRKIQDVRIDGKNVLIRIDTDILDKHGKIKDDFRLRASIPTLKYLLDNGAKVTIIGHIDRPKGKVVETLKMRPVEDKLIELLGTHQNWQILENLRFNLGEEENDPEFAKQLAAGQDIFIQDAFATCHRAHASTVGITEYLDNYAGLSVQKEVERLDEILSTKEKPFTAILGGAKIADKLPVIKNLISKADNFLIGGAIANTFLAARRHHMGKSLIEPEAYREANICWQEIMDDPDKNIYLPVDLVVSLSEKKPDEEKLVKVSDLLKTDFNEYKSVDIGPETVARYNEVIEKSKVIFWNGNMGVSEVDEFAHGTINIAKAIYKSKAQIVVGGGDTVAAVEKILANNGQPSTDNLFLSTGGGATLEFLAGKELPGLKVLE